jgi:hypothetical protein
MLWMRETVRHGDYRRDSRAGDAWVGRLLADRLSLDPEDDRKKITAILKTWFANRVLATEDRKDKTRQNRAFVIPGPWKDGEA